MRIESQFARLVELRRATPYIKSEPAYHLPVSEQDIIDADISFTEDEPDITEEIH